MRCTLCLCAVVSTVAISADLGEAVVSASVAESEIGPECRCHKTTLKCEAADFGNFFSLSWTSSGVNAGLCNQEFLLKKADFEDALENAETNFQWSDTDTEWSGFMKKVLERLKNKQDIFKADIEARNVNNEQGYALGSEEKDEAKYKDLKTGTKAFLSIGLKLNRAAEILHEGFKLSETFKRKAAATQALEEAIKGISVSKLEQAMEQGNVANVEMAILYQAQARQDELVALKGKVANLVTQAAEGKKNLEGAINDITTVKDHMTEVSKTQHDLGPDAMHILQGSNANNNVNVILERLEQMKASLRLEDSQAQVDKLSKVLTDIESRIGTK